MGGEEEEEYFLFAKISPEGAIGKRILQLIRKRADGNSLIGHLFSRRVPS